jgi:hypothetical protein
MYYFVEMLASFSSILEVTAGASVDAGIGVLGMEVTK